MKIGYWPKAFKDAKVTPIPKAVKNKSDLSSYRPISLLSSIGKLLERLVCMRLEDFTRISMAIHPAQFDFRPEYSTTHQLKRVVNHIKKEDAPIDWRYFSGHGTWTQSGRSVYYINCTYKNIQSTWYVCWEGFSQAGALQFKWKRPHQAGDICMQVWRKAHRFRRSYIRFEIAARSTHGFHLFIHWNEYVNFDIWIWEYTNSQIQILNFTYSFQCIHTWNLFELRTFPAIICRYFDAHVRHWYDYSEQIPRLYARQRRRNDTK